MSMCDVVLLWLCVKYPSFSFGELEIYTLGEIYIASHFDHWHWLGDAPKGHIHRLLWWVVDYEFYHFWWWSFWVLNQFSGSLNAYIHHRIWQPFGPWKLLRKAMVFLTIKSASDALNMFGGQNDLLAKISFLILIFIPFFTLLILTHA